MGNALFEIQTEIFGCDGRGYHVGTLTLNWFRKKWFSVLATFTKFKKSVYE